MKESQSCLQDPSRQLFVGGLPKKATNDTLKKYFEAFGPVIECRIVIDKDTQLSRGFAFVTFGTDESFRAVLNTKAHKYMKTSITVKPAMSKDQSNQSTMQEKERKIYIVGLPFKTRSEDLARLFSKYGEIESIQLKAHRGFGFIEFKNRVSVIDVLESHEQFMIEGNLLEVRPVLQRSELKTMRVNNWSQQAPLKDTFNMNSNQQVTSDKLDVLQMLSQQASKQNSSRNSKRSVNSNEEVYDTRPRSTISLQQMISQFRSSQ